MAERRIIFPGDHPVYPGKSLVIPEDATQEQVDEVLNSFSAPANKESWASTLFRQPKELAKGILEGYGAMGAGGDPETGVGVGGTMGGAIGESLTPYEPKSPIKPPTDTFSRYTRTAGENIPAMVTAPGGIASKLFYGPAAGLMGEGASDLAKHFGGESIAPYAKFAASVFGPGLVQKRITPNTVDPRRGVNNQVVTQELGPLGQTAGQATGNKAQMSSELKARPSINEQQADAFHERITAPTGSTTTNITPEWLKETGDRIKGNYDSLERTTEIRPGVNPRLPTGSMGFAVPEIANIERQRPQETSKVLDIIKGVDDKLVPHNGAMPGEKVHSALFNSIGTGDIPGQTYRRLRSNLYSAAENAATNEEAHTLRQYAHALDNAMARTNPQWGQAWDANNRRFANFRMAQVAANANKGSDQFSAKQWITAGHKNMGPENFSNSESGRFLDAYSKVMPELEHVEAKPSPWASLLGIPAGALASAGLNKLGVPWHIAEPLLGGFLGHAAGGDVAKLLAGRSVLPQMSPLVQGYKSPNTNKLFPAPANQQGQRTATSLMRALLNNPYQQKQPEGQ